MIRVMVAEDFEILRDELCSLIHQQPDMQMVGAAATGYEMVALAETTDSDVILMDVEMERQNSGILAAEKIRSKNPMQTIVFLTVHENDQIIVEAMATGAAGYIVKGSSHEKLLKNIRHAAQGMPIMDENVQRKVLEEYARLRQSERSLLFFINNISHLTVAERELVKLLLQNKKIREISEIRCVEMVTVKTQIKSLLRKFGCTRTREIVEIIQQLNLQHLF